MVVKVLAEESAKVEVVDRSMGIADRDVRRICSWVSHNLYTAQMRDRVGDFVLMRQTAGPGGANCFTFVQLDDEV
jgi:hypothetical protein